MQFNTQLLHGKSVSEFPDRAILPPVSQVAAFRYESMEELEKVFHHQRNGYAYSRIGNPTLTAFERRINEEAPERKGAHYRRGRARRACRTVSGGRGRRRHRHCRR